LDGDADFTFPTGTRSGSCLHAIFERLDFTDPDASGRRALVERELRRFGFATEWTEEQKNGLQLFQQLKDLARHYPLFEWEQRTRKAFRMD
jgi:exodeoxyribonuclease V beta subunit